ncbi:hypothetical protein [Sphingobium sp.]|uniref:hypothetical protein n=1 Tax=Sphingobium sp. TaxID=1912891 RepID=UPI003BB6CE5D
MLAVIAILMLAAALIQGSSYWPGIITWDAINQYEQALSGVYDDWHPPAMAWLWRQLIRIHPGAAPMYLIQLGLYWTGYALLIASAIRLRRRRAAILVALCAVMPFPLAIMGAVLKDCLMQGLLLTAVGLYAWSGPDRRWGVRLIAMLLLFCAGLLRFNAFLATVPLLVALLPIHWRRSPLRMAMTSVIATIAVMASMPLANKAIGADDSDVRLSLVIFDLGGITLHSGVDMFPAIGVANPVAVNACCYRPEKWDFYSSWADPPCPISFDRIDAKVTETGVNAYVLLARAIIAHPIAYAQHRLAHFNINTRFLVHDEVQGPAPDRAIDNDWGFVVPSNAGLRTITHLANGSTHSPLGWPIWWIALSGGLLALSSAPSSTLPSRWLIVPLTASTFAYGMGYLVFSVSSELRYHLWTVTGTAIAAAFLIADIMGGAAVPRRRLYLALAPAVIVGLLCAIWRIT